MQLLFLELQEFPTERFKMLKNIPKMYILFIMFILGSLTEFLLSRWADIGFLTWRCSEDGYLTWREPKDITLTMRRPENVSLPSRVIYSKPDIAQAPRCDVMVLTPWLAPIIWEGTFNRDILMEAFHHMNNRIGLTVFAIGKYTKLLKPFLESAERYFMKGGWVKYYVFIDNPDAIKILNLEVNTSMMIITLPKYSNWIEAVQGRMEVLKNQTALLFQKEVDYLVSLDVDMVMQKHIGVEILGEMVGVLHPGYYHSPRKDLPYERRPASQAFIPKNEGDFYYQGNFFVGTMQRIYQMTKACYEGIMIDKANGIQAVVNEESHLNKYFVYNKPTKILSPEYIWSNSIWEQKDIKIKRILHGNKKSLKSTH